MENFKQSKLQLLESEISARKIELDELEAQKNRLLRELARVKIKIKRQTDAIEKLRFTPLFIARDITATVYHMRGKQSNKKLFIQELTKHLQDWTEQPGYLFNTNLRPGAIVKLKFQSTQTFNVEKEATND